MSLSTDWRLSRLLAGGLTWILWVSPAAAETDGTTPAQINQLAGIVQRALESNLEIQAAKSAMASFKARHAGSELPLHNPQLGLEAERTDINTYTIGISQTIDWHDKQESLSQVAHAELLEAKAKLAAFQLDKAEEVLLATGAIQLHHRITQLSIQRTESLEHFVRLAEQRHLAGDIPQAELELARLTLAEARMQHVNNAVSLIQAKNNFFRLTGEALNHRVKLPVNLPGRLDDKQRLGALAERHPRVIASHLAVRKSQLKINATRQENKADPTLGVSAGSEDNDFLIGLSLSIPLQLRNSFQSGVDAAHAEAAQEEQLAQQVFRSAEARLASAQERYMLTYQAWSQWLALGRASLQQQFDLLKQQWHAGEMNTTDYLMQVRQSLDTQIASVQLHGELWNAWIEWLSASGSLFEWLNISMQER